MAATLKVVVKPKAALSDSNRPTQRVFARLDYDRLVLDDSKKNPVVVPSVVKVELSNDGEAAFTVADGAPDSAAKLCLETAQGLELGSKSVKLPADGASSQFAYDVAVETYGLAASRATPAERPVLSRSGRFTRFDDTLPDFGQYRLYAAPIRPENLSGGAVKNPQTAAVRTLLNVAGTGNLDDFEVVEVDRTKTDPATVNAVGLQPCSLRTDGTFGFDMTAAGDEVGWFWMLIGTTSYFGYQVDSRPTAIVGQMMIILPPSTASGGGTGTGTVGGAETGKPGSTPPLNFDEEQALDNPDRFGDDPGTECSPFTNPARIVSERRFFTVLRVDQPEIGGQGSLKISRPIVLDLAPSIRASAIAAAFLPEADPRRTTPLLGRLAPGDDQLGRSFRIAATTNLGTQITDETRALLEAAVRRPIGDFWKNWILTRSKLRAPVSPKNPIEWEGDPTVYQAASVAGGHILEYRVQWRSNGYSLGDVAYTLTLAPRQTRRISKVSWRRLESARRSETTTLQDEVSQTTARDRDYSDAVESTLAEWSKGGSKSSSTGAAGGIGFAAGPVVIGGGAAHGSASSNSWQSGGRRVAANEQQSLRDAIRQFGDSVRRLESTVVTEAMQEEEVEGVSETVRNINYCHALTVIYHEILRHYRVDTAFAGVRECLFVPFSITPFDVNKALKWRDQLRRGLLSRDLRWALDRLDEVATAWVDSDIPAGRRSSHPVNYLTGSAYVKLSIERPRDREEEEAIQEYRKIWTEIAPLLNASASTVIARLEREEAQRDVYFQREVAPGMAARWANRLKLSVNGETLAADFTLASSYKFGGTVRVDFTVPVDERFNRQALQDLTFQSDYGLPVGSVADLTRASYRYFTPHFDATTQSVSGSKDLILPSTGLPDPNGALTRFPLSPWEQQNMRRVIEDAVDKLIVHLNANLVYYTKVILWLMDRDELFMLLDGFTAPYGRRLENGKWVDDTGRSIASVVEREPIAILGNSLVYRVAGGVYLGIDGHESPTAMHDYYYDGEYRPQPLRVSLSTDGLYAQALMDKCEACEEHFGSTDWVLSSGEPELEALAGQLGTRRAAPEGIGPSQMPETLINLQNAPNAPDPTGLTGILRAVTDAGAFRDMAGLQGTQANAMGALNSAASLASSFGQMAVDFQKSKQGTADAKQKLNNIQKARSEGLIDESEAQRQSTAVLSEQNMNSAAPPLTETTPISNALQRAGMSGQPIEVMRQGQQGTESVRVGSFQGNPMLIPASTSSDSETSIQLASRIGTQRDQAWESLAPIAPRTPGAAPNGLRNLGTLLFIHDAETEIDLRDYGKYSDADAWMLVHTVSDLIDGLRDRVGNDGYVTGIHIEAHGASPAGFRMGKDNDSDGHIEIGEALDAVNGAVRARLFGTIIREALAPGGKSFISVASCGSGVRSPDFLKPLHQGSGAITIGSNGWARSGGNWWHRAWWETQFGRKQINADGTIKEDRRKEGKGIWRPF